MKKGNETVKILNLVLAVIVLVFGIAVGWAVNNYITNETKEEVESLTDCVEKNHEDIRDIQQEVEVNKVEVEGKLNLIQKDTELTNKKLDAIIKAINDGGGMLICDPIETTKENVKKSIE